MATLKNGFYSSGYYNNSNSIGRIDGYNTNVIARAIDNNKIYLYNSTNGRVVSLYTGVINTDNVNTNSGNVASDSTFYAAGIANGTGVNTFTNTYYLSGNPSAGVFGGKTYVAGGSLAQGVYNGRYYVNGLLGSTVTGATIYKNGSLYTGTILGPSPNFTGWNNFDANENLSNAPVNVYILNGVQSAGIVGSTVYDATGPLVHPTNGTKRSAVVNGKFYYGNDLAYGPGPGGYYKKGSLYTGFLVGQGVNDKANAVNATVRAMTPNAYADLCPDTWRTNGTGGVMAAADNVVYNGHYMVNGVLANGIANNARYTNGVLVTGDSIFGGVLFKGGTTFNGTLSTVGNQKIVTFAGRNVTVPATGSILFNKGIVAEGLIGNRHYDGGKFDTNPGLFSRNLCFINGSIADGNINGISYANGKLTSPSQVAFESSFTGLGNGIVGETGVYYENGLQVTSLATLSAGGNQFVTTDGPFGDGSYSMTQAGASYVLFASVSGNDIVPVDSNFTIEFFFKANTFKNYFTQYRLRIFGSEEGKIDLSLQPSNTKATTFNFAYVDNTIDPNLWQVLSTTQNSISAGVWYHVAVTRKDDVFSIYLNGSLNASVTPDLPPLLASSSTWHIGRSNPADITDIFDGKISNVRVTQSCIYNTNFVAPTANLTNIPNASLIYTYPYMGMYQATTVAGVSGVEGNDNGNVFSAKFNQPWGIVSDSNNNIFVSDTNGHTIRKITPEGVVSTFAGLYGYAGTTELSAGSAARFDYPRGMTIDSNNNIYVAEYGSSKIKKITSAGVVTTYAGAGYHSGPYPGEQHLDTSRLNSYFARPNGIALDPNNSDIMYVADTNNNCIRRVTSGGVTTYAGPRTSWGLYSQNDHPAAQVPGNVNGAWNVAKFNYPRDVAVDTAGNVYVADTNNHCIRKIDIYRNVTTFAGSSAGANGMQEGLGTQARMTFPFGIDTDRYNNIYVTTCNSVLHISPRGYVSYIANRDGTAGFSTDTLALTSVENNQFGIVEKNGSLYFTDNDDHTVRKISLK